MNSSRPIVDFSTFFISFVVPWTVYRTHKSHFWVTFSLKLGPILLFTYLKIILLQCFQFSVFSFSKISSIQTDPMIITWFLWPNCLFFSTWSERSKVESTIIFFYYIICHNNFPLFSFIYFLWCAIWIFLQLC